MKLRRVHAGNRRANEEKPPSSNPGGWTVTITRPGHVGPIVITSHGGYEAYPCGTVRTGDHVVATAQSGSSVYAGDPAICF